MKVGMIGGIGHQGYVFDGLAARPDCSVLGTAPGPNEPDAGWITAHARRAGHSPKEYGDFRAMLDAEKPDVVSVACNFSGHATVSMEALNRGCHVFSEKPLATTLEDFERLRAVFENNSAQLSCMFGIRYEPAFRAGWRAVREGVAGEIRLMTAQKSYKLDERPEHFTDRDTYGGTIPWVASHAIDWLRWFSGKDFKEVYARHSTEANEGHGDLEATALCFFVLEGEVYGGVNADYLRPPEAPTHGDDRIRIAGTKGVVEVSGGKVHVIDRAGPRDLPLDPKEEIFAEFIDQLRGEGTCLVSAEDAFAVTRACLLARQSADEGGPVRFD